MSDAEPTAEIFEYVKPDGEHKKDIVPLTRTDSMNAHVQVVREGGANNLHTHTGQDGFWMVLGGKARFYGEGDEVIAELGEDQGILIPHGYAYWFESADEEPLEILHISSYIESLEDRRIDHTARELFAHRQE